MTGIPPKAILLTFNPVFPNGIFSITVYLLTPAGFKVLSL
jgi:hypothetical protein